MKNWKLLLYSLGALTIYFLFKYAPLYKRTREIVENSTYNHPRILGYYVLAEIGGWFLLLFGILGLLLFFYYLFKTKN